MRILIFIWVNHNNYEPDNYDLLSMAIKLKVELSCREDNHEKKYYGFFMDRNLIVDDNNFLPGAPKVTHIDFTSDYSDTYDHHSKGKVNTRVSYPENSGEKGTHYVYCKLNWLERQRLNHFEHKAIYQKDPIQFSILILAFVGVMYPLCKDIFTSSRNEQKTESIIPTQRIEKDSTTQKADSNKIASDTLVKR